MTGLRKIQDSRSGAPKMAGENFAELKTLALNLGLTPDLLKFLHSKVGNQNTLQSTNLVDNFDGSVTITLQFRPSSNKSSDSQNKENTKVGAKPLKKHKTPSQRRRDHARFRKWLERKKERKVQNALNTGIVITPPKKQSPPPRPATPTSDPSEPVNPTPDPPDDTAGSWAELSSYCYCKYFSANREPFSELKQVCALEGCDLTTDQVKLKACTRCLKVAYCSRGHQKQDWTEHKEECDPYDGEAVMEEVRSWRQWKDGLHQCLSQSS